MGTDLLNRSRSRIRSVVLPLRNRAEGKTDDDDSGDQLCRRRGAEHRRPAGACRCGGTALVVDLDPKARPTPDRFAWRSWWNRVPDSPTSDLPARGIAVLRNGGVDPTAARRGGHRAGERAGRGWCCGWQQPASRERPVVPVVPLLPGGMTQECDRPAVYQQVGWYEKAPGPALTLGTPAGRRCRLCSRAVCLPTVGGFAPGDQVWEMSWVYRAVGTAGRRRSSGSRSGRRGRSRRQDAPGGGAAARLPPRRVGRRRSAGAWPAGAVASRHRGERRSGQR